MSWVMLSMRKMQLKQEVNCLEMQDVKISQTVQDLATYAGNIADGTITFSEMASCPSSLFGTQLDFFANSAQAAYQSATIKTNAYMQQLANVNGITGNQYGYAMGNADGTAYDAAAIFNEIYQEELKEYAKQMQEYVNQYEQELECEKQRIETQLQAKRAELQSYEQAISQNIQDGAIRLA